jgi:predicted O-methyltransferase YrrM
LNFSNRKDVEVIRTDSLSGAKNFKDDSLDFVYLDADHRYPGLSNDLLTWYPKIRPGGFLCGHDYLDGFYFRTTFGVKSAVDDFITIKNLQLYITTDATTNICPSWLVQKPVTK